VVVRSTVVVLGETTAGRTLVVVVLVVDAGSSRFTLTHPVKVVRIIVPRRAEVRINGFIG
jgi:hypothetical protein